MRSNAGVAAQTERLSLLLRQIMKSIHDASPPRRTKVPDLSIAQIRIIRILVEAGDCTMKELAGRARVTMPTATGLVDRLSRMRIVERFGDEGDRRVVRVRLSERGKRIVDRHRRWRFRNLGKLLERLSSAERRELSEAIETMARIFSKIADAETERYTTTRV